MCGEVVAAPLFCEKSKKFLKLCTAVRKKYKMKRLRRKIELPSSRRKP